MSLRATQYVSLVNGQAQTLPKATERLPAPVLAIVAASFSGNLVGVDYGFGCAIRPESQVAVRLSCVLELNGAWRWLQSIHKTAHELILEATSERHSKQFG